MTGRMLVVVIAVLLAATTTALGLLTGPQDFHKLDQYERTHP